MLYAALARSPYPHAALLHIDVKPALDLPGVHAVLAGQELGVTAVEYRGQCVAVAAADHPALARAALDAVEIQYAPGEPLLDARQVFAAARRTGNDSRVAAYRRYTLGEGGELAAPGEGESTVMYGYEFGRGADPAAAPGAVLAVPHFARDGRGDLRLAALDLHTACADPMRDLRAVSAAVGLPIEAIHLVPAPFTGTRSGDDPDLRVAAALLALRTGRPVRAEGGPADRLAGDAGTPAIRVHATHRVDAEGTLLAVRVELVVDGGADPAGAEPLLDELCRSVVGPYRCENVDDPGLGRAHAQSARRTLAGRRRDGGRRGRRGADRRRRGGLRTRPARPACQEPDPLGRPPAGRPPAGRRGPAARAADRGCWTRRCRRSRPARTSAPFPARSAAPAS